MRDDTTVDIQVTPRLQALFASAVINGKGGYQSLCRLLKARLSDQETLKLSPAEFSRVVVYATEHGTGGFQAHFRELVTLWVYQHFDTLFPGGVSHEQHVD